MRNDILLNEDFDLAIEVGDLVVSQSDNQHARLLLTLSKGDLTESPMVGIGILRHLKGVLDANFRREIVLQFSADAYDLSVFNINNNNEIDLKFD